MDKLVDDEELHHGDESSNSEYREIPRRLTDLIKLTSPVVSSLFHEFQFGELV